MENDPLYDQFSPKCAFDPDTWMPPHKCRNTVSECDHITVMVSGEGGLRVVYWMEVAVIPGEGGGAFGKYEDA